MTQKLYEDVIGFLEQTSEEFTRENANKPAMIVNTHRDLLAGILSKHMAMTHILPEDLAEWNAMYGILHLVASYAVLLLPCFY